jgi:hypothetical protein
VPVVQILARETAQLFDFFHVSFERVRPVDEQVP